MDNFFKIFIVVWVIFIYALVIFRIFIRKYGKSYTRENIGLIILSFTVALSNQWTIYMKIGFGFVGVILMIFILILRRRQ